MSYFTFQILRSALVGLTGRGYDRSPGMNNLHHKLSYRLHRMLPSLGIEGLHRVKLSTLNGKHVIVDAQDGGVAHQMMVYGQYEPFETELVRAYLKPGMTVWNIGANLGYYGLVASEVVGQEGRVYAFEPEPTNLKLLKNTIAENNATNVIISNTAISTQDGKAVLSLSRTNSGDHQLGEVIGRNGIDVKVRSVDSLISEGLTPPDAIIMDVQGSEFDVLCGMKSVLESDRPLILFTEFWPHGLVERHSDGDTAMLMLLQQHGFTFHLIDEATQSMTAASIPDVMEATLKQPELNLLCLRY